MSKELARTDQPFFIISFSSSQKSQKQYLLDEIERLNKVIKDYKKLVNETLDKREYVKALEGFRKLFTLKCMIKSGTPITILQCSGIVKRKQCKYVFKCKDRKELIDKIF